MKSFSICISVFLFVLFSDCSPQKDKNLKASVTPEEKVQPKKTKEEDINLINKKVNGFRGIWYMNQPLENEYKFKYSGGLGTYCAKHNPFAIYRKEVNKTFFCYGGTNESNSTLLHMISYYDHNTGEVTQPTLILDKKTTDAHDNPVMSIDNDGYIYVFSTSHGTSRPSYITKSKRPYAIDEFEKVEATKLEDGKRVPMTNFSYMQSWYLPEQGFLNFFTKYNYPAARTICFMTSPNGKDWSEWKRIAAIKKGHYQISAFGDGVAGSAFNFHPDTKEKNGLNWRTNLYYVETRDFGKTWYAADGTLLKLPLVDINNPALVHDYYNKDLNVYMKDITYDKDNRPVILFITSRGFEAGPKNDPRTWRTARWDGEQWVINTITTSDNNYDMGSLFVEEDNTYKLIAPTEPGPQPYNPGGEVAMWESKDQGESWKKIKQLTRNSAYNHTYIRRPLNPHPEFYGLWADGHGRQESESRLYISDKEGNIFRLPQLMEKESALVNSAAFN